MMAQDLRNAFDRSRETFGADLCGAAALVVLLMVGLTLPHLV